MLGDLDPAVCAREAVEESVGEVEGEARRDVRSGGLEPHLDDAVHRERQRELGEQGGRPRSPGDDQLPGSVAALGRLDLHVTARLVHPPRRRGLVEVQNGSGSRRAVEVGLHAPLDREPAGARLEQADEIITRHQVREARSGLGGRELLDGDAELARDGRRGPDASSDQNEAGAMEQMPTRCERELVPERIRALEKRYVGRTLEVGLADQPALPVGATAVVSRAELVEAEDARAAPGEMHRRRRAHSAETEHDDVADGAGLRGRHGS